MEAADKYIQASVTGKKAQTKYTAGKKDTATGELNQTPMGIRHRTKHESKEREPNEEPTLKTASKLKWRPRYKTAIQNTYGTYRNEKNKHPEKETGRQKLYKSFLSHILLQ